jgi:hypothetical protein
MLMQQWLDFLLKCYYLLHFFSIFFGINNEQFKMSWLFCSLINKFEMFAISRSYDAINVCTESFPPHTHSQCGIYEIYLLYISFVGNALILFNKVK